MRRLTLNVIVALLALVIGVSAAANCSHISNLTSQQSPEAKAKIEKAKQLIEKEIPVGSKWSQVQDFLMNHKLVYGEYLHSPERVKSYPDFKYLELPDKERIVHGYICTFIFQPMDKTDEPTNNAWASIYFDKEGIVVGYTVTLKEEDKSASPQ